MIKLTFLSEQFLENSIQDYALFVCIILTGLVIKRFISVRISNLIFALLKKHSQNVPRESFQELLIRPLNALIVLLFAYMAFNQLVFPSAWHLAPEEHFGLRMIIDKTYKLTILVILTWIVLRFVDFFALVMLSKEEFHENKIGNQIVPFIRDGIKLLLAGLSFFILLGTVFNVNVASIIAGLGIGGIAIALAAKETLENLLGSFTIFLDKPFELGDLVQVGGTTGTVEKIGFRSTRLRTLEKSYVTVPNKKMVDAETENLSLRTARRAKYKLVLNYDTREETLRKFLEKVTQLLVEKKSIDSEDSNVRFFDFGDVGLEVQIVFYINRTSHPEFLAEKEDVNFKLLGIISELGIQLASTVAFSNQTK